MFVMWLIRCLAAILALFVVISLIWLGLWKLALRRVSFFNEIFGSPQQANYAINRHTVDLELQSTGL